MEEKKLTDDTEMNVGTTDEEIVKAFDLCSVKDIDCKKCPYDNTDYCGISKKEIVDLVYCLQSENESLKKDYIELDLECRELRTELDKAKVIKAVKDTAKECYEIFKFYRKEYYDIPLDLVARDIKEKTGVEVE